MEGPYEKDALGASWLRVWLASEHLPDVPFIPGVVERNASPIPQLVTQDWEATLAFLAQKEYK